MMNEKILTNNEWALKSWRTKTIFQQPSYPNQELLSDELHKISKLPPLVSIEEINTLRKELVHVKNGEKFIVQIGDCAERFDDCKPEIIRQKLTYYNLMANVFAEITKIPSLLLGRIAGQYAKPRSEPFEIINGVKVPSFRGENVNSIDPSDRTPNPKRLTDGYFHAAATLNYIRQLNTPDIYDKFIDDNFQGTGAAVDKEDNEEIKIDLTSYNIKGKTQNLIYTSHEALLLDFEEALTRNEDEKYYNTSGHFLWIGERTRQLDGAHIEFMRALENPIGLKVSSSLDVIELVKLIKILNPENLDGKLTLITRLGARNVETALPKLITEIEKEKLNVLWVCDAVHGNTQKIGDVKTRKFDDVKDELIKTMLIFKKYGKNLNGIHLEITPEHVTECLGGEHFTIQEKDLKSNYTSYCDPRLNFTQGIDLVLELSKEFDKR